MPITTTLFKSNRSQAVRIPADIAFPDSVKRVIVTRVGKSVTLTPVDASWDDFFAMPPSPDFPERAEQSPHQERESF